MRSRARITSPPNNGIAKSLNEIFLIFRKCHSGPLHEVHKIVIKDFGSSPSFTSSGSLGLKPSAKYPLHEFSIARPASIM
jgi:hypothetical protein